MKPLAVILAGGMSSRMGTDKTALPFGGETMLSRLVGIYRPRFEVAVSVRQAGRIDTFGAVELPDLHPGQGPLAGLEAAFRQTDAALVFLTAADLPLGEAALAAALVSRIGEADACVIRRSNGEPEPLFAVYRRSCLQPVERCLVEGQRSCRALLEQIEVNWVREADLPEWDLDRVLWNVNTPEAYRQALRMLDNDSFS